MMATVTALSLPVVFGFPYAFESLVDRWARYATRNGRSVAAFVAGLFLIPLILMAI